MSPRDAESRRGGEVGTEPCFSSLHLVSQGSGQEGRGLRQWGSQSGLADGHTPTA